MEKSEIQRLKLFREQVVRIAEKINELPIEESIKDLNLLSEVERALSNAIRSGLKEC